MIFKIVNFNEKIHYHKLDFFKKNSIKILYNIEHI